MHSERIVDYTFCRYFSVKNTRLQRIPASSIRLIFALIICSCSSCYSDTFEEVNGRAMGTYYRVVAQCPSPIKKSTIEGTLYRINAVMSTYESNSTISRFNRYQRSDWFSVEPELVFVVTAAHRISQLSAGAFDITVGKLVRLWGFGPEKLESTPDIQLINEIKSASGFEQLEFRHEPAALRKRSAVEIDLSAIAKGYAVDELQKWMFRNGCNNSLIDIGGEISARGTNLSGEPWRIGIEYPDGSGDVYEIFELNDTAVASSGDYRNYRIVDGERISHVIDPRSGRPISHALTAVTIFHSSAMKADAWATAILVLGPEEGYDLAIKANVKAMLMERSSKEGFLVRRTFKLINEWETIYPTK